ncbi:acyl-CoA dehydrogenase family protein [Brevibacterium aurantiacum]|uniref:Acyl-CoA dehydrogenase n=1 Tax=Brevibacterium aurantiacum TaxID=273384 RepID=A0A2A3Z504_BREAU|nr:acyl-CoA dehydrogenase family protein [Brevibacterium aurantiacum]MDN5587346.1 acyl-CoA dehydrogenase family protein [Brevibacterium sp.]PCC46583.1 acyl-CoA dehydrogenase [Brevibacterium aurantiacum]PCC50763.1 acyl-CoA dehydrogenase [Brevibacterium aurantiacum]TGD37435.1 acyl-CoA dehydrogenase [Brevibacterium aurantiacum]
MTHKPRPRPNTPHFMTEERLEIQQLAREFARDVVLPLANELDPVEGQFPEWFIKQMADMGFFGILIPEEYGGLGLGVFEYCLVAEELSRAWMSVGGLLARGNGMGGNFSPEQEARMLPKVATGEYLGAFALSEAEAGSDVANIRCKAARADDGGWVINGTKMWCTFADQADYIILFARTSTDEEKRHRGISAFLVEKERGEFPEGMSGTAVKKIGYFGWKTWDLNFDDFHLPADALLGEEDRGFYQAVSGLEVGRAHTAARSIGLAQAALEDSIAYLKQRVQFGHPLADFQHLRFKVADMAAQIEASRALMYHVCTQIDSGARCDKEAAMVKYLAAEMAEKVTSEAVQIHGGAGYTKDFAVERHWRDARLTKIFEGSSEIQMRIISDELLGR